jgi:hypothetical protein
LHRLCRWVRIAELLRIRGQDCGDGNEQYPDSGKELSPMRLGPGNA